MKQYQAGMNSYYPGINSHHSLTVWFHVTLVLIHDWSYMIGKLKLGLIDKLLLEHVGPTHVLDRDVHLVNFFGLMSQLGHSEPHLL